MMQGCHKIVSIISAYFTRWHGFSAAYLSISGWDYLLRTCSTPKAIVRCSWWCFAASCVLRRWRHALFGWWRRRVCVLLRVFKFGVRTASQASRALGKWARQSSVDWAHATTTARTAVFVFCGWMHNTSRCIKISLPSWTHISFYNCLLEIWHFIIE